MKKIIRPLTKNDLFDLLKLSSILFLIVIVPVGLFGIIYQELEKYISIGLFIALPLQIITVVYSISMLLSKIEITNTHIIDNAPLTRLKSKSLRISEISKIDLGILHYKRAFVPNLFFYSSEGKQLHKISAYIFHKSSIREFLFLLRRLNPEIIFEKSVIDLMEKREDTFDLISKFYKQQLLFFIPVLIPVVAPFLLGLWTSYINQGLSDYQKSIYFNLFIPIAPLSVSCLAGLFFYSFLSDKAKTIKDYFYRALCIAVFIFFAIGFVILITQAYSDWFSQPETLIGNVKEARYGKDPKVPSILFKIYGNDKLWNVSAFQVNNQHSKFFDKNTQLKLYYSPNLYTLLKIEDNKTGELIYKK